MSITKPREVFSLPNVHYAVFLYTLKGSITLIINTLCVMPKISIFRQLRTIRRQIKTVFAVRTASLLILFTASVRCKKDREKPES